MKQLVVLTIHFVYWFCYSILLFYIFHILSLTATDDIDRTGHFIRLASGFAVIPALLSFYFSYTFLFNRFLKKKKILLLLVAVILLCYLATSIGGITLKFLIGANLLFDSGILTSVALTFLMSVIPLVHAVLAMGMRSFIAWYEDIHLKEELKNKNYETELALVKSQIDPHFLFNTINNIDTLIEMDATKASEYLNKLSDIMRFMLYESKTEKLPVSKELLYIEKYIDLQKIRTSNKHFVKYEIAGDPESLVLEAMLFIPFVENAFKHAENILEEEAIKITFEFKNKETIFSCENRYLSQTKAKHKGLGNDLIKKRLSLLFPEKHVLKVSDENGLYKVVLRISHED